MVGKINYVVAGGGRTGSHLVHEIMQFIIPSLKPKFSLDYELSETGLVIHTNEIAHLRQARPHRNQECLIVCYRRDVFAAVISMLVARHANEWFVYSDRPVEPFVIEPKIFVKSVDGYYHWYRDIDQLHPYLHYYQSIEMVFEDLVAAEHMEHYVADKLGWPRVEPKTDGWDRNRNPRNYQDIIINWHELVEEFRAYVG